MQEPIKNVVTKDFSPDTKEDIRQAGLVLDKLRTLDPRAVLAGGAPRDWLLLDKGARDLDFYFYVNPDFYRFEVEESIKRLGFEVVYQSEEHKAKSSACYSSIPEMVQVFDCIHPDSKKPIQLIRLSKDMGHNPESPKVPKILCRFNNSLSKVAYTGGDILATDEFLFCEHNSINFVDPDSSDSPNIARTKEKFPSFKFLEGDYEVIRPVVGILKEEG